MPSNNNSTSAAETNAQQSDGGSDNKRSEADAIIAAAGKLELWHDEDRTYVTVPVAAHQENHPVESSAFRRWLTEKYFRAYGRTPKAQKLKEAIALLSSRAMFEGPAHAACIRLAEHDGAIYLDLCDAEWHVVKIDASGWRLDPEAPVKFIRRRGMQELPEPKRGGSINELRRFLNVDDHGWIVAVSFIIMTFHPRGPYPILIVNGEEGSAKTTCCRVIRCMVDPNGAGDRAFPKGIRNLMIAATNSRMQVFDNLSMISPDMSDNLCRLSTGAGFATRQLYENDEERIFSATRPIILNGIVELATRPDLLDRSLVLMLPRISADRRQTEKEFWQSFNAERPRILGAVLDAVSMAMRNITKIAFSSLPRMADFAQWIIAAEPALPWPPGAFLEAHRANRDELIDSALDASPIAPLILDMAILKMHNRWEGTASELLGELQTRAGELGNRLPDWPNSPRSLANALRRIAPALRHRGIEVGFPPRKARARTIVLTKTDGRRLSPHQPTPPAPHSLPGADDGG